MEESIIKVRYDDWDEFAPQRELTKWAEGRKRGALLPTLERLQSRSGWTACIEHPAGEWLSFRVLGWERADGGWIAVRVEGEIPSGEWMVRFQR